MNNAILSVKRNKNIRMAVLFSAFMFVQFIILRMGNQAGRGFLAEQHQELVYLFIQIVVICGFFSHALIKPRLLSEKIKNGLTVSSLALCMSGALVMLFSPADSLLYLVTTGLTVFFLLSRNNGAYSVFPRLYRRSGLLPAGSPYCEKNACGIVYRNRICRRGRASVLPAASVDGDPRFVGTACCSLCRDGFSPDKE